MPSGSRTSATFAWLPRRSNHAAPRPLDAVRARRDFLKTSSLKLLEAGQLAVVPGVGYPNPNRSHFESMVIWHTARFDPEERKGHGWLGRALDPSAGTAYVIGGAVSVMTTDFRRVYAAALADWLGLPADGLGGKFEPLPLFVGE